MPQINESIASFLDALAGELQQLLSKDQTEQIKVSWSRDDADPSSPLSWWSCALSVDPACKLYAGTDRRTEAGDSKETLYDALAKSVEQAAKAKFGALVSCQELGKSEDPPDAWTRVPLIIVRGERPSPEMYLALSPDLATALGGDGPEKASSAKPETDGVAETGIRTSRPAEANPLAMIKDVEIPVSVSFGRTQMRLKDLLALVNGSVVQLDRELGDEVEIRVNNCVIARGEVVAVEGNYGVRILKMMSGALNN